MRIANGPKQRIFNQLTFGIFKEFLGFQILMTARRKTAPTVALFAE
jgi:hypothetical protein